MKSMKSHQKLREAMRNHEKSGKLMKSQEKINKYRYNSGRKTIIG